MAVGDFAHETHAPLLCYNCCQVPTGVGCTAWNRFNGNIRLHLSELAGSVDNEVTLASVASEDGAVAVDEQPDDEGHRQRELEKVLEGVRREEDAGVGNKSSMKCLTS